MPGTRAPLYPEVRCFLQDVERTIEIPSASLPVKQDLLVDGRASFDHGKGIWFREPVRKMTIFAEQYDVSVSLLVLEDSATIVSFESESESDTYDNMVPEERRREW